MSNITVVKAARRLSGRAEVKASTRTFPDVSVDIRSGTTGLMVGDGRVTFEYGAKGSATMPVSEGDVVPQGFHF